MTGQKRKIILTGYRATGKSTVGRLLAERLGIAYFDMDDILVARHGEIRELVKERGWEYFRARERELLLELVEVREGVIATGGGAVLHRAEWLLLKDTGLVVWLTADPETICRRLGADPASASQRPSLTGQEIGAEAVRILAERTPLYREGSHLEIGATASPEEIVKQIETVLGQAA